MKERNYTVFLGALALLVFILLAIILYLVIDDRNTAKIQLNENGVNAELFFAGNNTWEYKVNGTKANPCIEVKADPKVKDNSVDFILTFTPLQTFAACAQVVTDFKLDGSFNAPRNSVIKLRFEDATTEKPPVVDKKDLIIDKNTKQSESKGFVIYANYLTNNQWEYQIKGNLPNPCYKFEVDELIAESFPEQVSVNLTIKKPADDVICAQVIQEVNHFGNYSASEGASLRLNVTEGK